MRDPFDHILPHIVSIGSSLGNTLKLPDGSGTLVSFIIQINSIPVRIYGILSASHVVEAIDLITHNPSNAECIGLMKPVDRFGESYSETCPFTFIYTTIDSKHMRRIVQRHPINSNDKNERDVAFICLGIEKINTQSKLLENSEFFDLTKNPTIELPISHDQSFVFFKGACSDDLVQDGILATKVIVEQGGISKQYPKSKIIYHKINNTQGYSMNGASGAGLWMFFKDSNNNIVKILKGVIVEGDTDSTNAIDIFYITNDFIPGLEKMINNQPFHILGTDLWSKFYMGNTGSHPSI